MRSGKSRGWRSIRSIGLRDVRCASASRLHIVYWDTFLGRPPRFAFRLVDIDSGLWQKVVWVAVSALKIGLER